MRNKRKLTYEMIVDLDSRINEIPMCELPRIYDELNTGIWSIELGEPPVDFKEWPNCPESIFILDEIKDRCGNKTLWRYKRTEIGNYTPQMFEDWWDSTFIGGEPRNEFYEWLGEKNGSEQRVNDKNYSYETKQNIAMVMSIVSLIFAVIVLLMKN